MKFVKFESKYLLILIVSVALFSCSKGDQGDTGPQGPQGEQGIQGIQGPEGLAGQDGADGVDGQDGADGEDGNANVFVSDWIDTEFSTNPSDFSFFEVDAPEIDVNGAILVYGKLVSDPGSDFIVQFPYELFNERYTYLFDPGQGTFPNVTLNKIRFTARSVDGSDEVFERISQVRYVSIPPQPSGKSSIDFEHMSYEEVMDHFGLAY